MSSGQESPTEPAEWKDITPDNWQNALGDPFVFGRVMVQACRLVPRGVMVQNNHLSALLAIEDPNLIRRKLEHQVYVGQQLADRAREHWKFMRELVPE